MGLVPEANKFLNSRDVRNGAQIAPLFLDQLLQIGLRNGFRLAIHLQLGVNILDVGLGCLLADEKLLRDLRIGLAFRYELKNLRFPLGQG